MLYGRCDGSRRRFRSLKDRHVTTDWKLDTNGVFAAIGGIVFLEFLAEGEGLPADDGVFIGRIAWTALKDFAADQVFIDAAAFTFESKLADEAKESLQPVGPFKRGTVKNDFELGLHLLHRRARVLDVKRLWRHSQGAGTADWPWCHPSGNEFTSIEPDGVCFQTRICDEALSAQRVS